MNGLMGLRSAELCSIATGMGMEAIRQKWLLRKPQSDGLWLLSIAIQEVLGANVSAPPPSSCSGTPITSYLDSCLGTDAGFDCSTLPTSWSSGLTTLTLKFFFSFLFIHHTIPCLSTSFYMKPRIHNGCLSAEPSRTASSLPSLGTRPFCPGAGHREHFHNPCGCFCGRRM